MDENQNPLRYQLEQDLNSSVWLQKFKALSHLLQTIKTNIPLTQLCELKWDTEQDTLCIHCPNLETQKGLLMQSQQLLQWKGCARHIVLKLKKHRDIEIE